MTLIEEDITSIQLTERRTSIKSHVNKDRDVGRVESSAETTPNISRTNSDANLAASSTGVEFSLPPVDGGVNAWMVLIGGFVIEGFVWGRLKLLLYLMMTL
jgi:hypothetical protein